MLNADTRDKDKRNYNEVMKDNKNKRRIILVKPQQNNEDTEKIIKEKVDIKRMKMGVLKFKKGTNSTVVLECDEDKGFRILKETVMEKLGDNFKVTESIARKSKVKIINIGKNELEIEDKDLLDTIQKQNIIETDIDSFHMRLLLVVQKSCEP